jgi:hypothetical protein
MIIWKMGVLMGHPILFTESIQPADTIRPGPPNFYKSLEIEMPVETKVLLLVVTPRRA